MQILKKNNENGVTLIVLIITIIKPVKRVNINNYEEFLYPHGR